MVDFGFLSVGRCVSFMFGYVFSGCLLHRAGGLIFPVGVFGLVGLMVWEFTGGTPGACKRQCCSKPLRCRMLNSGSILVTMSIWVFPKIGGKNPKWMVKIMENPIKME